MDGIDRILDMNGFLNLGRCADMGGGSGFVNRDGK